TSLHKSPKCREVNYFTTMPPLPKKLDCLFSTGWSEHGPVPLPPTPAAKAAGVGVVEKKGRRFQASR
ncbi:MAG: hypothetical protein JXB10_11380, partial [Pirellulales bacterium]|nr:hypothetical protein [Pirellulales bacterium]